MPLAADKKVTSFVVKPATHDLIRWLAFTHGNRISDELERTVVNAAKSELERAWLERAWRQPSSKDGPHG